jgi:hypothetical protein
MVEVVSRSMQTGILSTYPMVKPISVHLKAIEGNDDANKQRGLCEHHME